MPIRPASVTLLCLLAGGCASSPAVRWSPAAIPPPALLPWSGSLTTTLAEAAKDGRPVLLHVRRPFDLASVTIRSWLMDSPELVPVLGRFHRVAVASEHESLKDRTFPEAAAVILAAEGSVLGTVRDAPTRAVFMARLIRTATDPRTPDMLKAVALQAPAGSQVAREAADALLAAGRIPEALEVLEAAVPASGDPEMATALRRRLAFAQAARPGWSWSRLQLLQRLLKRSAPDAGAIRLAAAAGVVAAGRELAGAERQAVLAALAELDRAAGIADPAARATAIPAAAATLDTALAPALRTLGDRALSALRHFIDQGDGDPEDRNEAQQGYLRQIVYRPGHEQAATAYVKALVRQVVAGRESLELLPVLVEAVIQLDLEEEHQLLAEKAGGEAVGGYRAAAANLDLADRAVERGDFALAGRHWAAAEVAATGESAAVVRAARAARALADGTASPNLSRWARRTALDVVVLVPDAGAFLAAISRWDADTFFPVLFRDDLHAPRFIEAYKPAAVYLAPATGTTTVDAAAARAAVAAAWSAIGPAAGPIDLAGALAALGDKPPGAVFARLRDSEALGGIALAAGRFQGFEELACEQDSRPVLSPDAVAGLEAQIRAGLGRYGLPDADGRQAAITIAAAIPYRTTAAEFPAWGNAAAVDDCLGRWDDSTRYAAVSRLIGDAPRAVYQAMGSLFLQPEQTLCFNTYGTDPKTIWGSYRTALGSEQFAKRMPTTEVHLPDASVTRFRALTAPWNRHGLIFINSSGGSASWSVAGGGGFTDDFPVGVPAAMHVTHSGTAGDPYNPDTLAGRALWGGAFWYFGSTAEPFLAAFQPPRYYAPRLLAGAPFSATFRQRTDDRFWSPWRLMMIGDPLFCLRDRPAVRAPYLPAAGEVRLAVTADSDLPALRLAWLLGDRERTRAIVGTGTAGWIRQDGDALGIALASLLRDGAYAAVVETFRGAAEGARRHYAARVHARTAAAALVQAATDAKDHAGWTRRIPELMACGGQVDFTLRHLKGALAAAGTAAPELVATLAANPEMAPLSDFLAAAMVRSRLGAVLAKRPWTDGDAPAASAAMQELLDRKVADNDLAADLRALQTAWIAAAADPETLVATVRGLKTANPGQARTISAFLAEAAKDRDFRQDWLFLGPFASRDPATWTRVGPAAGASAPDYAAVHQDGGRALAWAPHYGAAGRGMVDLQSFLQPSQDVHAYAAVELSVAADTDAILWLGSDDGVTVWLDGRQVHRLDTARAAVRDQDRVPVHLAAGVRSLVVRVDQIGGGWGFFFRLSGPDGKAEPAGVEFRRPARP